MDSVADTVINTEELKEVEAFDDDMMIIITEYEDKHGTVY